MKTKLNSRRLCFLQEPTVNTHNPVFARLHWKNVKSKANKNQIILIVLHGKSNKMESGMKVAGDLFYIYIYIYIYLFIFFIFFWGGGGGGRGVLAIYLTGFVSET